MSLYDCDCCGELRECSKVMAFGIETLACAECRGEQEEPTAGQSEALDIPPDGRASRMKAGRS
jgi:hypothetical protein